MKQGQFKNGLLLIIAVTIAACSAPKVQQEVLMPAREAGMQSAKKLAVFNISGDNGSFTAQVESFIANVKVNGKPYFEILERQMLDKIMAEQKMVSSSGLFNEKDAVKLGDLGGADTLIMGGLNMPAVEVRNYEKEDKLCKVRDSSGVCHDWSTVRTPCIDKSASVRFTLKAVSVQKGSIIFTKTYSGSASNTFCNSSMRAVGSIGMSNALSTGSGFNKSEGDVQNEAINKVLDGLRKDIAPFTVLVTIEFMEKDDVMSSDTKNLFKSAMDFVDGKRMDRACDLFKQAGSRDGNSPAVNYNMGVCAEIGGDFDRAESYYHKADRNTSKPDKLIGSALARVAEMKAKSQEVSKQMR